MNTDLVPTVPPWTTPLAPMLLVLGMLLFLAAVAQAPLTHVITTARIRRHRRRAGVVDHAGALLVPLPVLSPGSVMAVAGGGGGVASLLVAFVISPPWAVLAAAPLTLGCGWAALVWMEARLNRVMTTQLVATASQIAGSMNGGTSLNSALKDAGAALPAPLHTPWRWMTDLAGSAIIDPTTGESRRLQMRDTARAVGGQTTNRMLARFLEHVEAATEMPQQAAQERMVAVSMALDTAVLREAEAKAKLTHARVSGMMVVGVGMGIGVFLWLIMPIQWASAWSSPFAAIAGVVLGLLFGIPIVGIMLLSRLPNIDF